MQGSIPHTLVKAWLEGLFDIAMSQEQMSELRTVVKRKKFQEYNLFPQRSMELLTQIETIAEPISPISIRTLPLRSRDPKDDFLLAAALGGSVEYLITGDEDLLNLHDHPALDNLQILTAKTFLKVLDI